VRLRAALAELSSLEFFLRGALELVCARFDDARDPFTRPHAAYALVECESGEAASARFHEVLAEALEDGAVADAVVAQSGAQAEALWFLREGIAEAISKTGLTHKFDVTVPPGAIPSFIEGIRDLAARFEGVRPVFFGHLGDGNLHLNMVQGASLSDAAFRTLEEEITEPVYALVADFEGSISAEHGIGVLKRKYLGYSRTPDEIATMRAIKGLLDPRGILNPGAVLEP
jgi:FAD/FMN-containing dehydrogenase